MPNTLKHKFTSAIADDLDSTIVRPSNWNDEHLFSGGADGEYLQYFTANSDKVRFRNIWLDIGYIDVTKAPYNADNTGVTLASSAILSACNDAIAAGKAVFIPSGIYLCTYNVILLTFTGSPNKTFCMFGAGADTILKMRDGDMNATGRRFVDFRPAINMDLIEVRDLVLDNNARGSTPPPSPFDYEQSHTLRFAGAPGTTTKLVRYHNVVIKDPVADGINNQNSGIINYFIISNCSEIDRTRVRSSIEWSYIPENTIITGFTGDSIESEPVSELLTPKVVTISNSVINILDIAGSLTDGTDAQMSVYVNNTYIKDKVGITDCLLKMSGCDFVVNTGQNGNFYALRNMSRIDTCIIRLPYNDSTGAVTGLSLASSYTSFPTGAFVRGTIHINNCEFRINKLDPLPFPASGFLLGDLVARPTADVNNGINIITDCYFDPRCDISISCYRNGKWYLKDNIYGGSLNAVDCTATAGRVSDVTIDGGDFRAVTGAGIKVPNILETGHKVTLCGIHLGLPASKITKFASGTFTAFHPQLYNTRIVHSDSLPTQGITGDIVRLTLGTIATGGASEYIATTTSDTAPGYVFKGQKGIKKNTTGNRLTLTTADIGLMYMDTTLHANGKPIWWNGSLWVDSSGASV